MVNNVRSPKYTRLWAAIVILIALAGPLAEQSSRAWGAEPEAPAVEPPAQPNLLLRKLFQLFDPRQGMTPVDNEDGTKTAQPAKDSVDGRLPKDPQIDALWRAGKAAVDREEWQTAVELLQKLLDLPEDAAIQVRPGEWSSVRATANQQIAKLPVSVRADYARHYSGLAERLYAEAVALADPNRVVDVATRYFHTPAGASAAAALATWHLDQQEYTAATWWNRELLASDWSGAADPRWRLQAALAARQAGVDDVEPFLKDVLDLPQPVELGGRRVMARDWWQQTSLPPRRLPVLNHWENFGGSASRVAAGPTGTPLLLPEWSQPLSDVPAVRERLQNLLQDLTDDGIPLISAHSPIVQADKIAFRDLCSVRVVELATGNALWQTAEGVSPERILNGVSADGLSEESAWRVRVNAQSFDQEYQGDAAEMHPLASWLFRDATNGFLSSDGERLYVLEDVAVMTRNQSGYSGDPDADQADPFGATWSSNRLSAYDWESGRLVWTIGGPVTKEPVTLPLAGSFFFGVPTADRDELYVVTATGQEIRLQVLEAATGRPRWSQLLAFADTKIELDIARRWLSAPVAIQDGLIVCPTTVGWLIAVDRTRRCLLWAHRYWPRTEEEEFDPSQLFLPQLSLQEGWSVGAPIVVGNQVLFAPPDADALVCLNLLDGKVRWHRERTDGLYVTAVDERRALIVNQSSMTAVDVVSGDADWILEWEDGVRPSGRGCVFGGQFAIPFSTGTVWLIDIESGTVSDKLQTYGRRPPLGNLVKAGHRFVSLGPDGCQVFSERERFLAALEQQRQTSPTDIVTQLQGAEYELLQGRYQSAVDMLANVSLEDASDNATERHRKTLWTALTGLVEADPAHSATSLDRLAAMARDPEERFRVESARTAHLIASGNSLAAWEHLWLLATNHQDLDQIPRPDDDDVMVDCKTWIAGRLQDLWREADGDLRARLDDKVRTKVDVALAGPVDDWVALAPWVDFHPDACRLRWSLAERWGEAHMFPQAEAELLPLAHHSDPTIAIETQLRLARLWRQFGLSRDAAEQVGRVQATVHVDELRLSSGWTIPEAIKHWQLTSEDDQPVSAASAVRQHQALQTVRLAAAHIPPVQELVPPLEMPFYDDLVVQLEPQEQRLSFQSRRTGEWMWLAPLRGLARSIDQGYSPYKFLGHRVVVVYRDVLQVLSPVRRELVWSAAVGTGPDMEFQPHRPVPSGLIDTSALEDNEGLFWTFRDNRQGRLAVCNHRAIGILGRRSLDVFDPQSGRLRWSHRNVPVNALVFGTEEAICVIDGSNDRAFVYRTCDGRPMELPQLHRNLQQALTLVDNDLIQVTRSSGLRLFNLAVGKVEVRRQNLITGNNRWAAEFRPGTQLGCLGDQGLLAVGPAERKSHGGQTVEYLDLRTGRRQRLDRLPFHKNVDGFTPLIDRERIYVLVNHGDYGNYNYGDSLPSTRVHGTVFAWDRASGRLLWSRKINDQNLILDRFEASPVLIFLARNWKQVGLATYTTLHLLALNKDTGEPLHDSQTPSLFNGFHGIQLTEPEHEVELVSYNMRLRLTSEPLTEEARAGAER